MIKHLRISVDGKTYNVVVEDLDSQGGYAPSYAAPRPMAAPAPAAAAPAPAAAAPAPAAAAEAAPVAKSAAPGAGSPLLAPLGGVVVSVAVKVGDVVVEDQEVCVLEAMKMKTSIGADRAGTITSVLVSAGDAVDGDQPLVTIQ